MSGYGYGVRSKRPRGDVIDSDKTLDEVDIDATTTKLIAAEASPWVVSICSRFHDDMADVYPSANVDKYENSGSEEIDFLGSGVIIECQKVVRSTYSNTVFTCASLFERTTGDLLDEIEVGVYLSDGTLLKGQVIACDFHYNLAAIQFTTDFQIPTAKLRALDDAISIDPTLYEFADGLFLPVPHSSLCKIVPGTKIIRVCHANLPSKDLSISSGVFGATKLSALNCNELYWTKGANLIDTCGGPVLNCSGEVVGIGFYDSPFLPSNIILRWWEHFKSCGQYRRPWLGVEVINLYSSNVEFLEHFMMKFPNIFTGVVVTEVAQDSPASCSGIRPKDVIVECNGKAIASKLQFFDAIWDMVGESVDLSILRVSDEAKLKLNLTVGDTSPDKFYKWRQSDPQQDVLYLTLKKNKILFTPGYFIDNPDPSTRFSPPNDLVLHDSWFMDV